jgi:hypothetical protein
MEVEKVFVRRFQTQIVNVDFNHVTVPTLSARHSPSECHSLFLVPLSHFCMSFLSQSLHSSLVDERRFMYLFSGSFSFCIYYLLCLL